MTEVLPLRERKKLRTRQALAETAVTMFTENGFEATTLDTLVEAVEVSKRTFFRNFRSKEDVALTATKQFWETYLEVLDEREPAGLLIDTLRDALLDTVERMDDYWYRQFLPTLHLIQATPALEGHSRLYCTQVQGEIIRRLGRGKSLQTRLLVEIFIAGWHCAATEWADSGESLSAAIERTFAAISETIALT